MTRRNSTLEDSLALLEKIRLNAREREARQASGEWLSNDLSGHQWPALERQP